MADLRSVNSPRRILSLSRRQRESFSFRHADANASGFGLSGEHSPKPAEVYGFVGSISTVVATVIFLIWAYVPEAWLHGVGIFYYPSRYWALAIPVFCAVTIVLGMGFYIGLNFMSTLPPTSLNVIYDKYTRDPQRWATFTEEDHQQIEPISDIGICQINDIMFSKME